MQVFRGSTCGHGFGGSGTALGSASVLDEEAEYPGRSRRKDSLWYDRVGPPSGQKYGPGCVGIFVRAFVCFQGAFFHAATVRCSPECCACVAGVQESNPPRCRPPSAAREAGPHDLPLPKDPPTPPTHLCALFGAARPVCVTTKPGLAAPDVAALAGGGPWVLGWSARKPRQGV